MRFAITGDIHGDARDLNLRMFAKEELCDAIIVLGDFGANYFFNKRDIEFKTKVQKMEKIFYCVRGNHEARPETLDFDLIYDNNVQGNVYIEKEFDNIRYLIDGEIYNIEGRKTLVIGGAYSVDKYHRLASRWTWFDNEQLTEEEMKNIENKVTGQKFDLVLTHTCPLNWQPKDLFLPIVDQSLVENDMEIWMEKLRHKINWKIWLFGHYHANRLVRPHVEMFFNKIDFIDKIFERWKFYDEFIKHGIDPMFNATEEDYERNFTETFTNCPEK